MLGFNRSALSDMSLEMGVIVHTCLVKYTMHKAKSRRLPTNYNYPLGSFSDMAVYKDDGGDDRRRTGKGTPN